MEEKEITVNGYTFTVEQHFGDENFYRLIYGEMLLYDDSACEDFYGDIETVADIMASYVEEETMKPFPWFTLRGSFVERGGEREQIWDEESAKAWGEVINSGTPHELTDEGDIKRAKARLGFDEEDDFKHVYSFDGGSFILKKDWLKINDTKTRKK